MIAIDSVLPQALFQLYAESIIFQRSVDDVWESYLEGKQGELSHAMASNLNACVDFLAMTSLLSQLRVLGNHISSLAWRFAHILQKEEPGKALLPEPGDLYQFNIQT